MGGYLYFWVVMFAVAVAAMAINRFFPYPKRSYLLDDSDITVSKGSKTKKYLLNEFSSFFVYGYSYDSDNGKNKGINFRTSRRQYKEASSLVQNFEKKRLLWRRKLFILSKKRPEWANSKRILFWFMGDWTIRMRLKKRCLCIFR